MKEPITYKALQEVKKALVSMDYSVDKTVKWDWAIPEGQYFENKERNFLVFHPHDVASLLQATLGSDEALDFIKKRLHERITNMFRRHWEMDIYKSTGYIMNYAPERTTREEVLIFSGNVRSDNKSILGMYSRDSDGKIFNHGMHDFSYEHKNPSFYNVFELGGDRT